MKKIYGYAFAAATMLLASCSSDAPEATNSDFNEKDVIGYIQMNLPEETRASDGKTYVVFYKDGQIVQCKDQGNDIYAVTAVPDKVIAFKNDAALRDSQTATTTNLDGVSPAVYGDNTYGSPVGQNNIFHKLDQVGTADAVTVYVEPVAAKANVEIKGVNDVTGNKFDGYTIKFVPEYTFVNGVAVKTPMIKNMIKTGKTNGGIDWNNAVLSYNDASGKGSHWTATDYAWNTADVKHYKLRKAKDEEPDDVVANKGTVQNGVLFFERARQSASNNTKDFTHVIVAGRYVLYTGTGEDQEEMKVTPEWDGTFYVYGTTVDGTPRIYLTEKDVLKAMGSDGKETDKLEKKVTTVGGMSTHMQFGTETCLKYDKGYVYYAEPIVTKIGETTIGKGVVRNHEYHITITEIKGIGTAIPDITEPIIPENPKDPESSFIKLNININPMVQVPGQTIKW